MLKTEPESHLKVEQHINNNLVFLSKLTYTDDQLILLLKSKDQRAYNYLYDNYSSSLFAIIRRIVGEGEEASDVLQETFVKIWRNIEQYDKSKGRLFTWMINVARNTAIDFLRSGQSKKDRKTNTLEPGTHVNSEHSVTHINTDGIGFQKVVGQLKDDYRIIIDMAYYQGYTQDEIAKELEIPLGTVKTRCRAALTQLKQILNHQIGY